MQKSIKWSFRPYRPYFFDCGDIYICRIAPDKESIRFEWLGEEGKEYTVFLKKRADSEYTEFRGIKDSFFSIDGLEDFTDYEFYVQAEEKKSRVRLAKTGRSVGTVVNYLHPDDMAYSFSGRALCSPSIVRHPDGFLLASMDLFVGGGPQNLTLIYRSDDDGSSWHYVSELMPCFWGKMFIHKGELYMLSVSTEYGDLLIGKSTDGGVTFEAPTVLMRGSCSPKEAGVHKNPENIVYYNGRLYATIEWGAWAVGYHAPMVISCDENADLLDADNWSFSAPVKYDPTWEGVAKGESSGNIEGTLVVAPDGKLYNIMRYDMTKCVPSHGLVVCYEVNTEDHTAPLKFNRVIKLDGNHSKFIIKKDEQSGYYYTLLTRITDDSKLYDRRLLSLMRSKDVDNWELVADIIDKREEDHMMVGFQYVDFEIEGDDIIFLCRTAMNSAKNFHDANYSTFHRIKNFRNM